METDADSDDEESPATFSFRTSAAFSVGLAAGVALPVADEDVIVVVVDDDSDDEDAGGWAPSITPLITARGTFAGDGEPLSDVVVVVVVAADDSDEGEPVGVGRDTGGDTGG